MAGRVEWLAEIFVICGGFLDYRKYKVCAVSVAEDLSAE